MKDDGGVGAVEAQVRWTTVQNSRYVPGGGDLTNTWTSPLNQHCNQLTCRHRDAKLLYAGPG